MNKEEGILVMLNKVFIFPGQGAQYVGMGKEFCGEGSFANSIFNEANDILGYDLKEKIFNGPEEELKRTEITQPAVFITEIIMYKELLKSGINAVAAAGHSLGEYAALVASGAIKWQNALKLVKFRGETFRDVGLKSSGTLIAVIGMTNENLEKIINDIDGVCEIVNYNSPGQVVVGLEKKILKETISKIKEGGAKIVVPLKVSGAFHSSLMNAAVEPIRQKVKEVEIISPKTSFYSNYTGDEVKGVDEIKNVLIKQVNSPVKWMDIVENISRKYEDVWFVEIGPGNVLQGLLKRINRRIKVTSISQPQDIERIFCDK